MTGNRPILTISLLISNRLDTISQCLDSLRPIREAIPSELILIDTSKNPQVHELLLQYTDQVYEFDWVQDFAKARNEGLRRANGEWFLYLDDDEWFVEVDELIEFFKSGEYKDYAYANYIQRNFIDDKYIHYNDYWATRMAKLEKGVRFVSKIHEYFVNINGKRKDIHAIANHSGYIFSTPEKRRAHFERNHTLLLEMIQEEPANIRWRLQLAQEYSSVGEWEDLERFCKDALKLMEREDTDYMRNNIGTFYAGLTLGLIRQKKYREAIDVCNQAFVDKRCREVLRAMMYLRSAECYLHLKEANDAISNIDRYLALSSTIDRSTVKYREQQFALLVGDALDETSKKIAYNILICAHLENNNINALREYYEKLCWKDSVIYSIDDVEKFIIKAMWTMPYENIFMQMIIDVLNNKDLRAHFRKGILENEIQVSNEFQMALYDLMNLMQAVIDGPQENDLLTYAEVLQIYVQAICQWYDFAESKDIQLNANGTPTYVQAAMDISDYLELESKDPIQALGKLKDAVEILPEFAEGIGQFLHYYSELETQRMQKQNAEMKELRVQVISQVKAMFAAGQKDAALQIIGQLKQMFPGDLEVVELEKLIK